MGPIYNVIPDNNKTVFCWGCWRQFLYDHGCLGTSFSETFKNFRASCGAILRNSEFGMTKESLSQFRYPSQFKIDGFSKILHMAWTVFQRRFFHMDLSSYGIFTSIVTKSTCIENIFSDFGCSFYFWGNSAKNVCLYRLGGPLASCLSMSILHISYHSPTVSEVLDTLSWVSCATLRRLHVRFQQTSIMMPPPCGSHLPRFGFFLVGIEVVIGLAGFQQLINTCFCRFFKDSRCIDLFTVCVCVLLQRLVQDQVILGSLQWRGTSFQDVYNINDLSTTQYQNQNPPSWEVQVACETTWS